MSNTTLNPKTMYLMCARGAALNAQELAAKVDELLGDGDTGSELLKDRITTLLATIDQLQWAWNSFRELEETQP